MRTSTRRDSNSTRISLRSSDSMSFLNAPMASLRLSTRFLLASSASLRIFDTNWCLSSNSRLVRICWLLQKNSSACSFEPVKTPCVLSVPGPQGSNDNYEFHEFLSDEGKGHTSSDIYLLVSWRAVSICWGPTFRSILQRRASSEL